jgi:glycogen synthase
MRILMTADTVGGVFSYAVDLARGLRDHDDAVTLVTFGQPMSADQRGRVTAAGVAQVHETSLALEWMEDPWTDLEAAETLLREVERDVQPDVVHLNGFAHGAVPFRAPVLVAAHSCVFSWWEAVHGGRPPAGWQRYRAMVRGGLAGAAAVVAPSAAMLDALERCYGRLEERGRVIYNGSGYVSTGAVPVKQASVLAAGRLWDEAKNIAALIRIARRPGLAGRITLAGEGMAASAAGPVTALGPLDRDELAPVRRRAAVYAAPAWYEPFGLGILEAARDHCALVLADIPSLYEIWDDAALYVDPGDDDALAAALEHLLTHPGRAAALGLSAHRRAARFTVEAMSGAYRRVYQQLVATAREVPV